MKRQVLFYTFLFLTGCQGALPFPKIPEVNPPEISEGTDQLPVSFTTVKMNIPMGQVVAAFPYWRYSLPNVNLGLYSCNIGLSRRLSRSTDTWDIGNEKWETWKVKASEFVEPALSNMGYDVVSTRQLLFNQSAERKRAELKLGASIVDLKLNLCHFYSGWDWKDMGQSAGTGYVKVKWELYDPLQKKVVATIETQGTSHQDDAITDGEQLLILKALGNAAYRLGADPEFYRIITKQKQIPSVDEKFFTLTIYPEKISGKSLEESFSLIKRAVITVRTSSGHGSGFFISNQGYALTSASVVDGAKTVMITDSSGVQYKADVLRVSHLAEVALLKAHVTNNTALPLQTNKTPSVSADVYVMGTPVSESYKTTLTKGVFNGSGSWNL